jgi:hypothetical protein
MQITDIDWDTDGEDVGLPSTVMVPSDLEEDEIADYLSDNYGWLVNGFVMGAESLGCSECGKDFEDDEDFRDCDLCGVLLCGDCNRRCEGCSNTVCDSCRCNKTCCDGSYCDECHEEEFGAETFEAQRMMTTCDGCGMTEEGHMDYCSHCDMDFCDSCDHFGDFRLSDVCEDSVNILIEDSQYVARKGERR